MKNDSIYLPVIRQLTLTFFFIGILVIQSVAQSGRIEGRVFDARTNEPLPFTNIILRGTNIGTTSDLDGNFIFTGVTPGFTQLMASSVGYEVYTSEDFLVTNAKTSFVNLPMTSTSVDLETVVVRASPFVRDRESPVSLRRLNISEIERNPGSNRDISKMLQSLPGVASTPAQRNDVIVRGGGPSENSFYLDGIEIPTINHFSTQGASGGPVGIINVDFIREVNFYSGAFPAKRGNALSSVIDFRMIDPNKDRWNYRATLGATDVGFTANGPLSDKSGLIFSVRRSYLQFLFDVLGLPFLPTYNDLQFKYQYNINQKNQLTIIGLGALDKNRLNTGITDPNEEQQYILGYLPTNNQWSYTVGAVYRHFSANGFHSVVLSRNALNNEAYKYLDNIEEPDRKTFDYNSTESENKLRYEYSGQRSGWDYNYGAGLQLSNFTDKTFQKQFIQGEVATFNRDADLWLWSWNAFGQVSRAIFQERLTLSLGARMDANDYSSNMSNMLRQFSPRLSASYALAEKWFVNANVGRYYQRPAYTTLGFTDNTGDFVNKDNGLKYIRVDHVVAGLENRPNDNSKITLEGFYKLYNDYPFSVLDSVSIASKGSDFGIFGNEEVVSSDKGRAYGFELYARDADFNGFNVILSYTFVRSQFEDKSGTYIPAAWDNKHLLNLTVLRGLKKNWNIGGKWRFVGGTPYTPFDPDESSLVEAWDVQGGPYLDYGRFNTLRLTPFTQLDMRVDKQYFFDRWSLMVYVDIQNIYNFQSESPPILIRQLDGQGQPIILNPTAPPNEQRYLLKELQTTSGTVLPTIGVMIEF
jgi:outer membrane receptor for ferrienterochelin and colicin